MNNATVTLVYCSAVQYTRSFCVEARSIYCTILWPVIC